MNMFKNNGGFTLVELIVVIAILAILAAVAVPAYTGYIAKAEQAGDLQVLSAVNTAVQGLVAAEGKELVTITVKNDASITIDIDGDTDDDKALEDKLEAEALKYAAIKAEDFSTKFDQAVWKDGEWTVTTE